MALKLAADPDTRTITVTEAPVGGLQTLDVVNDIYEALKEDWQVTATLQVMKFPFRSFGDPKSPTEQIGPYVFFANDEGWRFQPFDVDHDLTLVGNLTAEDTTQAIWLGRAGRSIVIRSNESAQALTSDTDADLRKLLQNDMTTDPVTGQVTVLDDDDTTPRFIGTAYEDAAKTQPYRGQGAEARTRLVKQ